MILNQRNLLVVLVVSLAILLGACGPAASNAPIIATSVAATVQAQSTALAAVTPTLPPDAPTVPVLTTPNVVPTNAPPTAPTGSGSNFCQASATFVGETIPDGTIMSPGQVFYKTWRIKNTGTCPWNSAWKWVFTTGDLMGGAAVYPMPSIAPGQTMDMAIQLTAPTSDGSYTGYWKIQSQWGTLIADSGSGNPYWVTVVVGSTTPGNSKTATVFDVTSVSYDDVTRRCTSANTFWNVTAHISTNGPVTVVFTWVQSDGNNDRNNKLVFNSATTLDVTSPTWSQGIASSTNPRWVQIVETSPTYKEFAKSPPLILCGN